MIIEKEKRTWEKFIPNVVHIQTIIQYGERIKVHVFNLTGAVLTKDSKEIADNEDGGKILEPGELISRVHNVY